LCYTPECKLLDGPNAICKVNLTKMDATGSDKNLKTFSKKVKNVHGISAVTGSGLKELVRELFRATAPGDGVE